MHRILFALLLAAPLAPAAQPLAPADSALVERLMLASGVLEASEQSAEMMESMMEQVPFFGDLGDSFSPEAGVDSIRAAFVRDFRAEALQEAIDVLERPELRPLVVYERSLESGFDEFQAEVEAVLLDPDAYALADRALIADYVRSLGWADRMGDMMRTMMVRMMAIFPTAEEEAAAAGMTVDEHADSIISQQLGSSLETEFITATRYVLKDVDKAAVRTMTEFYSSDAGRYYLDTQWAGSIAAAEPMFDQMMESMAAMFAAFEQAEDAPPPPCKKSDCEASGVAVPPPPPPSREGRE